jgi:hypothetical protein
MRLFISWVLYSNIQSSSAWGFSLIRYMRQLFLKGLLELSKIISLFIGHDAPQFFLEHNARYRHAQAAPFLSVLSCIFHLWDPLSSRHLIVGGGCFLIIDEDLEEGSLHKYGLFSFWLVILMIFCISISSNVLFLIQSSPFKYWNI